MRRLLPILLASLSPLLAAAAPDVPAAHRPKAADVQRYGPAYRYPQAGWLVLHVEGEPYPRGYQQGRLLAKEIAAYIRMLASERSAKAPADGWKAARQIT